MAEWISVSDQVPKRGEIVIMYVSSPQGSRRITFGQYWVDEDTGADRWYPDDWDGCVESGDNGVSHWMPLPEPPVEEPWSTKF